MAPDTTVISRSLVKPDSISEEAKKPYYLTPWDIPSLDYEYGQFGLLFNKPDNDQPIHLIVDQLKNSLAATLTHFFPLSGRLVITHYHIQHPAPSYSIYIDCKDPAGAEFVHAVASNLTVSDILAPTDVPMDIIESLFAFLPGTANNLGHAMPLLGVQVTQLVDGIFIAFSISHAVVDGTSYWHFINSYSKVCRSIPPQFLSRPPVTKRWFLSNQLCVEGSRLTDNASITPPPLPPPGTYRQKTFNFTSQALAFLKRKANIECHTHKITCYQALTALIWRSATRARGLKGDEITTCAVPINSRSKLEPPLSNDYFGNCITTEFVSSRVDELLSNNLGWAARKLHDQIIECDNDRVRSYFKQFTTGTCSVQVGELGSIFFGSSPWFDVYGNNFGWGDPVAVRWSGEVMDGYVHTVAGRAKGSIDLTVSLYSRFMDALELDKEFMGALEFVPLSKIRTCSL